MFILQIRLKTLTAYKFDFNFFQADQSFCCIVLRLRKTSLRKMVNDPRGLVNDEIKKQVLEGLKPLATFDKPGWVNGDIKKRAQFLVRNAYKIFLK